MFPPLPRFFVQREFMWASGVAVVFASLDHRLISASLSGLNRNHGD